MNSGYRLSLMHSFWKYVLLSSLWLQNHVEGDDVPWGEWSAWSSCSAHCGYGISTRSRQCSLGGADMQHDQQGAPACSGASSQIKVCSWKCPPGETSRNQRSCSEFDSRMFSGKQYVWEPFIHLNSACKMSCRAKGVHFYANLADRAEDGTPCKLGTADAVCVTGVCKRIGCDGVVESAAVKDICGLCSGDGSTCQTISGIFTSTELKRGINHIISIPAGSTNINITELQTSRNLLIMQTGAGATFINSDTRSPTSSVVEAAGTVFTYSTKSLLVHKESIFSPGPTNSSVILKLLMRGRNPGIMYTFNVPREVTGTIIQQIRHHSHPVELSPESKDDRHQHFEAFSSKHDDSVQLKNYSIKHSFAGSTSVSPFILQHDQSSFSQNENLPGSTNIINNNEPTSPAFSATPPSLPPSSDASLSNVYTDDLNHGKDDVIPNFSDNDRVFDELSITTTYLNTSDTQVTEAYTVNPVQDFGDHRTTETFTVQSTGEDKDLYLNDKSDVADNVDRESVNPELTTMADVVLDDETNPNDNNSSNGNSNKDNVTETSSSLFISHSTLGNDSSSTFGANNVLTTDSVDNKSPRGDELLHRPTQPSNNITRNVEGYTLKNELDNSRDVKNETIPKGTSEPSILDAFGTRQHEKESHNKIQQNVGSNNSLETSEEPILKVRKTPSSYKIPRYSQSFTFAERYKDNNSNSGSHRSRPQHARRQHIHQKSPQISPKQQNDQGSHQHSEHSTHNQQANLNLNSNRNDGHLRAAETGFTSLDNVGNGSIRDHKKVSQLDRSAQHTASGRHQSNREERFNKEAQDRQIIVEERRRRMEEQRTRYKQRLQEYNEMLRQRQADIDESRRRSSLHVPRKTDHRNSANNRGPHHRGTYPSGGSREELALNNEGSQTLVSSSSPAPDRVDTHRGSQANGRSQTSNRNANAVTNQKLSLVRADHSTDNRHQDQLGRVSEHSQTDTSGQQTGHQPSRREGHAKDREPGRHNGNHHTGNRQAHRGTSSGQEGSKTVPVVIQPPNLEYPEYYDGDRVNPHSSRIIPRVQQPPPRYIPGVQPRAAQHSALSGAEVQQEVISNKISGDNHISPSRQSPDFKQAGSADVLSNHISLNKPDAGNDIHSSIYEWRISGLSDCTHSCGGGVQQTIVVCVDTLTQAVVTDENCKHIPKPKLTGVPCNTRPCSAEWTPGPWSSCSVTCGKGEQTRTVTCQARVSPTLSMTMPTSNCESQEQIASKQACSNKPCSSWRVGHWSNCSAPCGDGHRTREVQCVDQQDNVVSDDACSDLMPDSEELCSLGQCGKGWFFTDWPTECPAECGSGEVTRTVFCADDAGSALPDSRCDSSQRPAVSQPCRVSRPCGGLWFTGQWSKCDARCGSGNKRRAVLCIKELPGSVRAVVDEENCQDSNKPTELEQCQAASCTSEWYTTSWSQCSQSCGTGYRTREVKCLDPDQKPSDCPLQSRPKTRDACNTHECADVEAKENEENSDCVNKFAQCNIVKRARLCQYSYYKTACCKSCTDDT